MIATLLDLRYKMLLKSGQISHAKKECLNGSDSSYEDDTSNVISHSIASASNSDSMEPQCKWPHNYHIYIASLKGKPLRMR